MSRYEIRVRQADSLHGTFACDSVYVDDGGDLKINRSQRPGDDLLTIARFQHGHWSSYELEPTVEATADDCAEAPVKAEALPEVGSIVHMVTLADAPNCLPMRVKAHSDSCRDALLLGSTDRALLLAAVPDWGEYESLTHDESRTESGSWHWPDHGDGRDGEAEPKKPAPINMTINVSGTGISTADLRDQINRQMLHLRQQQ